MAVCPDMETDFAVNVLIMSGMWCPTSVERPNIFFD
jgi:hypothetical protein